MRDHCEAYLAAEVLPYRPDAWIDHGKVKVGYEIPFNRHFYEYGPRASWTRSKRTSRIWRRKSWPC